MPIYPYQCDACGAEFEVSRKLSAMRDPAACPACGTDARRLFAGLTVTGVAEKPGPAGKTKPAAGGWSHAGHSHGPGSGGHTHGLWGGADANSGAKKGGGATGEGVTPAN